MTTLVLETEPLITHVALTDEKLTVDLVDGRSLSVPLNWYPRLLHATPKERQNWQLLGDAYAIEWVELDEHIGVEGLLAGRASGESQQLVALLMVGSTKQFNLLAGRASGESQQSLERWLSTRNNLRH